jgi:dolichol-phosphate mannosyltransferase
MKSLLFHTQFKSLAVVIPMYNEVDSLPLLAYRLKGIRCIMSQQMDFHIVAVDDGSSDLTYQEMRAHFEGMHNIHLLRHSKNQGYSAALRTGVDHALELDVDLIVTIDADTNYDHFYIPLFVDNFSPDCDIMTASPWHPEGQRKFFPRHRLALSLGLSACYRWVLRRYNQPLFTYSSCFRVAKADVYRRVRWTGTGFMATSEIMARCVVSGFKVKEFPFQVNPRWFGQSKMQIYRQMKRHLAFLLRLWWNPEAYRTPEPPGPGTRT